MGSWLVGPPPDSCDFKSFVRSSDSLCCRSVAKLSQLPLEHMGKEDTSVLFGKIQANSLHIVLDHGDVLGLGLYPFCSMLNHSDECVPIFYDHMK